MKIAYFATQNINYIKPLKNERLVAKKSYWFKLRNNEQLMAGYKCKYTTCIPETKLTFFSGVHDIGESILHCNDQCF